MKLLSVLIYLIGLLLAQPVLALDAKAKLDRNLGLLIGDEINMTIDLPVDSSQVDTHSLPAHGQRLGHWLVVHDLTMQDKTLTFFMQLINVPAENREVVTPELVLRTKAGEFINVASVPMQIGSFLQEKEDGVLTPKADANLPDMETNQLTAQLWLSLSIFVLSLLIWLVWHLGLRPHQQLPFAKAMLEMNKMRLFGKQDSEQASRVLHGAFNASAGRVVVHSQLEQLWSQCPWLAPLKDDINQFYADSSSQFFSPEGKVQVEFSQLKSLAKACRALEKMA